MEPELKDFSKSDEFSDLILVVEDKKLHVHRVYLAEWSPVFRQMFIQQSAKKNFKTTKKIPLPGKKYEEITEMLHCIYSSQKAITGECSGTLLFTFEINDAWRDLHALPSIA